MKASSRRSLCLGDRTVGPGHPCFVIAEAGVNHDGNLDLAHELIEVAAACSADAVKFQTFRPESLVSTSSGAAPYQRERGASPTQRQMLERLALPRTAWKELGAHAATCGLVFLSTPFDLDSLELLLEIGVRAIKIPSGELNNVQFIGQMAANGIPVIISTGMGDFHEVAAAIEAASAAPGVALLHCVTAYPAPLESSNLRAIPAMAERFDVPVGWSDHTQGYITAVASIALGASILEKHFTTDRSRSGPDHAASADPDQLAAYVAAVRAAEESLGDGIKRPAAAELENVEFARRSYHATRDLSPGDILREDDVCLLRPATGLPPGTTVVGRVVAREITAGQALRPEDLR